MFSDNNTLVEGQLISKDDLFYISQQKSTYYYENTFPIWCSINDGNWKLIGDVIRKLADESAKNLEIVVVPIKYAQTHKIAHIKLGKTENSPDYVTIPQVLVKVVVDRMDRSRGLVFYTVNDPYISAEEMEQILVGPHTLCTKTIECNEMYPDFSIAKKGLTYCCSLQESNIWKILEQYNFNIFI